MEHSKKLLDQAGTELSKCAQCGMAQASRSIPLRDYSIRTETAYVGRHGDVALLFSQALGNYRTPAVLCQNSPTSPTLTRSISTMPAAHTSINSALIANA